MKNLISQANILIIAVMCLLFGGCNSNASNTQAKKMGSKTEFSIFPPEERAKLVAANEQSQAASPNNDTSKPDNKPLQESEVLSLCAYIPDHGITNDAKQYLTNSYFRAYTEAADAPTNPLYIGDNEFLYYFVSGQDGEPIFSVKSIEDNGDYATVKVYLQEGYNGVPWSDEKTLHTLKLVRDTENNYTRYRIDDWDDTKQQCLDYIRKVRSEYKSGSIERSILREGGSSSDVNEFRKAVSVFYKKYGESEENSSPNRANNQYMNRSSSTFDYESLIVGKQFSHMSMEPITGKSYRYVIVFKSNGVGKVVFSEVQPYGDVIISKDNTRWKIVDGNQVEVNVLSNDIAGGVETYTICNTALGVCLKAGDGTRYD